MNNKQNEGKLFEERIHNILKNTKSELYREKDIRSKYSTHISGIDHLLINDNYCIAIQDKHVRSKKPTNNDIHHFKTCVNDLSKIIKKKIIGIYLSIMEPTSPAIKSFEFENKTNNNQFIFINNKDIDKLIYEFISFLYDKNIYIYDEDDLYMLDEKLDFF
jgi:hypothetical protein